MVAKEQGMAKAADEQCRVCSQTSAEPDTRTVEDVTKERRGARFPDEEQGNTHREGGNAATGKNRQYYGTFKAEIYWRGL